MDLAQDDATAAGSGWAVLLMMENKCEDTELHQNLSRENGSFQESTLASSFACCSGSGRNGLDGSYRDGTDQVKHVKNMDPLIANDGGMCSSGFACQGVLISKCVSYMADNFNMFFTLRPGRTDEPFSQREPVLMQS